MRNTTALSLSSIRIQDPVLRVRLTVSVSLYAAALGSAAILISIMARTGQWEEAAHLTWIPGLISAITGAIAATVVTPLAIYHLRQHADDSASILLWLLLGIGFAVGAGFVTGALVPLNVVFITFAEGDIKLGELPSLIVEGVFQGIRSFFIDGALSIYTWLIAGVLFGVGAWIIDKLNTFSNPVVAKYGPLVLAISMGITIVAIAAFGPPETLRKFG